MPKASSRSIDKGIGARLKHFRQRASLSQTALGKHLGVSFQQVQKYENGTNRISAATLVKIARSLDVTIADLLAQGAGAAPQPNRDSFGRFVKSKEGKSLIHGFLAIGDPDLRRQILGLVRALGRPHA